MRLLHFLGRRSTPAILPQSREDLAFFQERKAARSIRPAPQPEKSSR